MVRPWRFLFFSRRVDQLIRDEEKRWPKLVFFTHVVVQDGFFFFILASNVLENASLGRLVHVRFAQIASSFSFLFRPTKKNVLLTFLAPSERKWRIRENLDNPCEILLVLAVRVLGASVRVRLRHVDDCII